MILTKNTKSKSKKKWFEIKKIWWPEITTQQV